MNDIIIIGAGPIGLYGGYLASLHSLKGVIIEALEGVGGQLTSLYPEKDIVDLPGFPSIKAKDFINKLYEQYNSKDNKLDLKLNEKVLDILKEEDHYLIKTDKEEYITRTVVITTGMGSFSPRLIGLDNESQFKNIAYSCSDSSLYKNKDVIILGGGDSAVDLSLLIKPISKSTTIIHRRNDFRAQDSTVQEMKDKGVNILLNKNVLALEKGDKQDYLTIEDKETKEVTKLAFDNILVQYGQVPSKDEFPVEKENNLILVKDYYETSLEHVFACGNIITYLGKVKNITSGLGEITTIITKIDQIINPNKNIPIHF